MSPEITSRFNALIQHYCFWRKCSRVCRFWLYWLKITGTALSLILFLLCCSNVISVGYTMLAHYLLHRRNHLRRWWYLRQSRCLGLRLVPTCFKYSQILLYYYYLAVVTIILLELAGLASLTSVVIGRRRIFIYWTDELWEKCGRGLDVFSKDRT